MSYEFFLNSLKTIFTNTISLFTNPSWPQVGIFFLIFFRKDLKIFLQRIIKFGKDGIIFETNQTLAPPATIAEEIKKSDNKSTNVGELTSYKVVKENCQYIEDYMKNNGIKENKDIINFLQWHLSEIYFILRCERVYRVLFGSQLRLLEIFSQNVQQGLSENYLIQYFNEVKKTYSDLEKWDLQRYLNFLKSSLLIGLKENNYHLTEFGQDFLNWLKNTTIYEEKKF